MKMIDSELPIMKDMMLIEPNKQCLNCRINIMKHILNDKLLFIDIGSLLNDEIEFIMLLNYLGIIKHLLFCENDGVNYYIECEWRNKI